MRISAVLLLGLLAKTVVILAAPNNRWYVLKSSLPSVEVNISAPEGEQENATAPAKDGVEDPLSPNGGKNVSLLETAAREKAAEAAALAAEYAKVAAEQLEALHDEDSGVFAALSRSGLPVHVEAVHRMFDAHSTILFDGNTTLNPTSPLRPGFVPGASLSLNADGTASRTLQSAGSGDNSTCNYEDYNDAYSYELANGLFKVQLACQIVLRNSGMMNFFPPTAWEIFHAVCKGPCRDFYTRAKRLLDMEGRTGCTCGQLQSQCPLLPNAMLCAGTGLCLDNEWYQENVCASTACGRWATNEADYRAARKACGKGMSLDVSGASSLLQATFNSVAALGIAAAAVIFLGAMA